MVQTYYHQVFTWGGGWGRGEMGVGGGGRGHTNEWCVRSPTPKIQVLRKRLHACKLHMTPDGRRDTGSTPSRDKGKLSWKLLVWCWTSWGYQHTKNPCHACKTSYHTRDGTRQETWAALQVGTQKISWRTIKLSDKSPSLSPPIPSCDDDDGICKVRKFYHIWWVWNAESQHLMHNKVRRVIIVVVEVGAMKIYVTALEALREKERQDETQLYHQCAQVKNGLYIYILYKVYISWII